jgi:hypothetical protein
MAIDNVMQRGLERWPSEAFRCGVVTGRRIVLRRGGKDGQEDEESRKCENSSKVGPAGPAGRCPNPAIPTNGAAESKVRSRVHGSAFGRTRLAEFE